MVSVKQLEGEYPFVKSNAGSEQSKCHQMPPTGIKTHLYWFGSAAKGNSATSEEGQSLLDALLLSQWEDHLWKGQLTYDVTMCETKIIRGRKKFIAQLNEKWNANFLTEFEKNALQPFGSSKPSYTKILKENLLFCVASGEKESPELVSSTVLAKEGTLVVINVNPVEYGHIFMVPYGISQRPRFLDKKMLYWVARFATEINNCSFRIFIDHNASINSDHVNFQAAYFASPLPVELLSTVSVYGCMEKEGVNICELSDYPLKVLLFTSQNMELLAALVAEICFALQQDNNVVFNLLISNCATKVFLFPQVYLLPAIGSHLTSWECGGYFIYNAKPEFDSSSEGELLKRLASASLDDEGFQALKCLCCSIAIKLHSDMY